jgi:ribosomal-protein-alanine acetyltransferase
VARSRERRHTHHTKFQAGTVRPLRLDDIDAIAEILVRSPGAASWSLDSLRKLTMDVGVVALVCELGASVTGFIVARQAGDEAEILNLAVRPQSRRAGRGSALLVAALKLFHSQGVTRAFLEVRESNASAIAFYAKHGFVPAGRRNAYYRDPPEDAVVMEKKLTT